MMRAQRDIREEVELGGADWGERAAVNGGWAETGEGVEVFGGAVAFMGGEAVAGVEQIEFEHDVVASDFGDDACGGDGVGEAITFWNGGMWDGQGVDGEAIDEGVGGWGIEL